MRTSTVPVTETDLDAGWTDTLDRLQASLPPGSTTASSPPTSPKT